MCALNIINPDTKIAQPPVNSLASQVALKIAGVEQRGCIHGNRFCGADGLLRFAPVWSFVLCASLFLDK